MLVRNWNLDWTCKNILFWNFQSFNNLLHSSNYQSCYKLMSDILNFGCYFFLKDQKLGQQVSDYFSVVQGLYCNKQRTNPQKYSQSWLALIFFAITQELLHWLPPNLIYICSWYIIRMYKFWRLSVRKILWARLVKKKFSKNSDFFW